VCAVQVVMASRLTTTPSKVRSASAIVVVDSPTSSSSAMSDMAARLKWTSRLYGARRAKSVVVIATRSGSAGPWLNFAVQTLRKEGVPRSAILRLSSSSVTQAFSDAAKRIRHNARVIVVTDAIDALWTEGASSAGGLRVEISSPPGSHKSVLSETGQLWRQTFGVAMGRVIGFGRTTWAAN
ncbi:MAG TPA: hypothetical protein VKR27_08195, partial [Acidimicrobiales bacterium]|nr:hypothetical protein [Acidimicrobiales bacterium]